MTQPTEPKEHVITDSPSGKFYFCNGLRHSYDSVTVDGFNCCLCGKPLLSTVPTMEQWEASLSAEQIDLGLKWGENPKREPGRTHIEWHVPCGCAFHPEPFPHVHPCSDEHKRPDLHAGAQEQSIIAAAREWATAWGKVWDSDEPATTEAVNEVNDKSKSLHDAVLDLERIRGKQ